MHVKKPWDFNPELTEERLVIIANMILDRRNSCLETHDEDEGDTSWGLHCRSFDRCHTYIKRLALSESYEWLSLVNGSMKLQFKIGEIIFRFYRGDPNKPNQRALSQDLGSLDQGNFDFGSKYKNSALKWLFAVETDVDGEVIRIVVVGCSTIEDIRCTWDVPIAESVRVISSVDSRIETGVHIPAPRVSLPEHKKQNISGYNDNKNNDD